MNTKESSFNLPTFINIPFFIYQDKQLEWPEKFLFSFLWSLFHAGRKISVTNGYLSEMFNVSERYARELLENLEKKGYIFRNQNPGKRRTIVVLKSGQGEIIMDDTPEPQFLPPRNYSSSHPGTTVPPYIKEDIKEEIKDIVDFDKSTKKTSSSSQAKDYQQDERFMRFYSSYPRREKPRDAWKAFKSIKPNDELLERIIYDVKDRTDRHTQWVEKQYIPLPASYLRSASYDGDILNEQEEVKKKINANNLEASNREKDQEQFSQKQEKDFREKQNQYNQDGVVFRKLATVVLSNSGKEALRSVREHLRMEK